MEEPGKIDTRFLSYTEGKGVFVKIDPALFETPEQIEAMSQLIEQYKKFG